MPSYENPRSLPPTDSELERIYPDNEPAVKTCANCDHAVTVMLDGKLYDLCVVSRDKTGKGAVDECDLGITDCDGWD